MQTYVEEFTVKCIMGELEINDSNWETFLRIWKKCVKMNAEQLFNLLRPLSEPLIS